MSGSNAARCATSIAVAGLAQVLAIAADGGAHASDIDAVAARKQFVTSCGTCHAAEPGAQPRQGPNLHGIFGRKAGSVEGFNYSESMKTFDLVWDEKALDRWIENAQAMRPGVNMPYRQADPAKRALIVAFLKSVSPTK